MYLFLSASLRRRNQKQFSSKSNLTASIRSSQGGQKTIRKCVLWQARSPTAYRFIRECGWLSLPCHMTLKRYVGPCTDQAMSSLIQQRLTEEVKKHGPEALHCSLVMDAMSIEQSEQYQRQGDVVHGLVKLGGLEKKYGMDGQLATHLLCFVLVGLSTSYR
ncbi:uncharacterized protein LOC135395471 [Ornithodoros turicata]|uniref:uncharacterized protein LOC135395471 n=1 Tax=Ornithodoros turicata TaxID=34597 RepID=UPI0031393352